jgi:hypothetical protein
MQLAKSISELNTRTWYRRAKVALVLSFVAAQALAFHAVRSGTRGEVSAPISYLLIGRMIKEDFPSYREMGDEQAGRHARREQPDLWKEYVQEYEKAHGPDPVLRVREYGRTQRIQFHVTAFLLITLFFETIRRAFYFVIFGKIFPRKTRRRRLRDSV